MKEMTPGAKCHRKIFPYAISSLVPIVWLPVSRRSTAADGEGKRYTRRDIAEFVDLRLRELLLGLSDYHSRLNAQLFKRYKAFEYQVLSAMLYSKDEDQPNFDS